MDHYQEELVLSTLYGFNPWWGGRYMLEPYHRICFWEVQKALAEVSPRRAVMLDGPRRAGKSTILMQLAEEKSKKVDPLTILYVSLDHPVLEGVRLDRILDLHQTRVAKSPPSLYLFDEVQYTENGDRWIKLVVDQRRAAEVVVTGSASLDIRRARESGAGRWATVAVPTLTFLEYVELRKERVKLPRISSMAELADMSTANLSAVSASTAHLESLWCEYMVRGGLPEGVVTPWPRMSVLIREDVVDRVLTRDIPQLGPVDDPAALRKLFVYLCVEPGRMVSAESLAQFSGLSRPTASKYLHYLVQANLVRRIDPVSLDGKKVFKLSPKYHLADLGVRNAMLSRGDEILRNPTEMGWAVESGVISHLWAYYRSLHAYRFGYWRAKPGGKEIDFVAMAEGRLPELTEVKFREDTTLTSQESIVAFPQALTRVVVTKLPSDLGRYRIKQETGDVVDVIKVPARVFLLLVSQMLRERADQENQGGTQPDA